MATVSAKQFYSLGQVTPQGVNEGDVLKHEKEKAEKHPFTDMLSSWKERAKGVGQQVKNIYDTATDENLSTGERVIGAVAEAGRTPLKAVGAVGGAVGDAFGAGLEATGVTDAIGKGLEGTKTGDAMARAAEQWKQFSETNPELASTLGDIGNILNIAPSAAATDLVRSVGTQGVKTAVKDTAAGAAGGAGSGGAGSGGFAGVKEAVAKPLAGVIEKAGTAAEESIKKDVTQLLSTRSLTKKVQDYQSKGVDLNETLSEPSIFSGVKVENRRINPNEAIETIDKRVDTIMEAKKDMLPEIDRLSPDISREDLYARAAAALEGKQLPGDTEKLLKELRTQIDAMPENMKPSQVDAIRAQARKSGRDAKGIMKDSNVSAAIEKAARDAIFDATDNLPVANAGDYKALNDYVKKMLGTREFLDESLRNQKVEGGIVRNLTARAIGAVAGAKGGLLGAIAGSEVGGAIADIITNASLGSSAKMRLIRNMTDDPKILDEAERLLKELQVTNAPGLPAPGQSSYKEPTIFSGDKGASPDLQEVVNAKAVEKPFPDSTPMPGIPIPKMKEAPEPYVPDAELPVINAGSTPRMKPQPGIPVINAKDLEAPKVFDDEVFKNIQKKLSSKDAYESTLANGGVTISLAGDKPARGFAYAPSKTTEFSVPKEKFTQEVVDKYVDDHLDELVQPGNHIGMWESDGKIYMDISRVGEPNAKTLEEAMGNDQLAVFDLETFEEVPLGKIENGVYNKLYEKASNHPYLNRRKNSGGN